MPAFGGLTPNPERYGGGTPAVETILESLNAQRGTAYDTSIDSNVYAENLAVARAIAHEWSQNKRLSYQFDPRRITDFLPRWEAILEISPPSGATEVERRAVVLARIQRIGTSANTVTLTDTLTLILGSTFLGIARTPSSSAVVWTPAGWPVGSHGAIPWSSSVAHLAILVAPPAGMSEAVFYRTIGTAAPLLDDMLPAWVTWAFVRDGAHGAGFYLDEDHNLDNERFDT